MTELHQNYIFFFSFFLKIEKNPREEEEKQDREGRKIEGLSIGAQQR